MERLYARRDPWGIADEPYNARKLTRLITRLRKGASRTVLEIGCGEGTTTRELAAHAGRLDAIDISARAVARAKTATASLRNVHVARADLAHWVPARQYDAVLASEVLGYVLAEHSVLDVGAIVGRLRRALRPGGRILTVTTTRHLRPDGREKTVYYPWARSALHAIFLGHGFRVQERRTFTGVKHGEPRTYTIIVYSLPRP